MKKKIVTLTAAMLLTGSAGLAQTTTSETTTTTTTTVAHVWSDPNGWYGDLWNCNAPRYNANELTMDFFGSFLANQRKIEDLFKTNIRSGHWGGGVGVNYFFIRELGIGGDINMPADGGNFINAASGSLIARLPIGNSGFAPYIFGGGGRQTQPSWEWFGHAGVGMEYRFNPIAGIFTDARYMWVKNTPDELLLRAGLRVAF
jgi:hypothetical protein